MSAPTVYLMKRFDENLIPVRFTRYQICYNALREWLSIRIWGLADWITGSWFFKVKSATVFDQTFDGVIHFLYPPYFIRGHEFFRTILPPDNGFFGPGFRRGHDFFDEICDGVMIFFWKNLWRGHDSFFDGQIINPPNFLTTRRVEGLSSSPK